jgi:hypothetical protein
LGALNADAIEKIEVGRDRTQGDPGDCGRLISEDEDPRRGGEVQSLIRERIG